MARDIRSVDVKGCPEGQRQDHNYCQDLHNFMQNLASLARGDSADFGVGSSLRLQFSPYSGPVPSRADMQCHAAPALYHGFDGVTI